MNCGWFPDESIWLVDDFGMTSVWLLDSVFKKSSNCDFLIPPGPQILNIFQFYLKLPFFLSNCNLYFSVIWQKFSNISQHSKGKAALLAEHQLVLSWKKKLFYKLARFSELPSWLIPSWPWERRLWMDLLRWPFYGCTTLDNKTGIRLHTGSFCRKLSENGKKVYHLYSSPWNCT